MQLDCHYYGTYYMAYLAGFTSMEARQIAWAAQTVDEMTFETVRDLATKQIDEKLEKENLDFFKRITSPLEYKEKRKKIESDAKATYSIVTVESVRENADDVLNYDSAYNEIVANEKDLNFIGRRREAYRNKNNRMVLEMVRGIWCPFHFLPGDISELNKLTANVKDVDERDLKRLREDLHLICQPSSQMCNDMIELAKEEYEKYESSNLKRALYAVGICMHVLADTWTHQDFCGSFHQRVNQGSMSGGYYDKGRNTVGGVAWTSFPIDSPVWTGHGSVGTNPDIPGITYEYTPYKREKINVDNPTRFRSAFLQMYDAMVHIRNKDKATLIFREFTHYKDPDNDGDEIVKEISKLGKAVFTDDFDTESRCYKWEDYLKNIPLHIDEADCKLGLCTELEEYKLMKGNTALFQEAARVHRDKMLDKIYSRNLLTYYRKEDLNKYIENELYPTVILLT